MSVVCEFIYLRHLTDIFNAKKKIGKKEENNDDNNGDKRRHLPLQRFTFLNCTVFFLNRLNPLCSVVRLLTFFMRMST